MEKFRKYFQNKTCTSDQNSVKLNITSRGWQKQIKTKLKMLKHLSETIRQKIYIYKLKLMPILKKIKVLPSNIKCPEENWHHEWIYF